MLSRALLFGLAVPAMATLDWQHAPAYNCPSQNPPPCTPDQTSSFSGGWSGLTSGQTVGNYAGFGFSGFTCQDSFQGGVGKRDLFRRNGGGAGGRCVQGSLGSKPSISCGAGKSFSANTFHVSVSKDTNVDCIYKMPGGNTCTHTVKCSMGSNQIQNTQCGGAQQVTFQQHGGGGNDCQFGVHQISFHCQGQSSSSLQVQSSTVVISSSTAAASTSTSTTTTLAAQISSSSSSSSSSSTTSAAQQTTPSSSSTTSAAQQTTPSSSSSSTTTLAAQLSSTTSSAAQTTPPTTTFVSTGVTTSTIYTTSVSTVISCGYNVTNCPAGSTVLVTSTVAVTTTVCPVTATITSALPPVSPPAGPPVSPPAGPPVSPPAGPPVSPPAGPPVSPPAGPPVSPPVSPVTSNAAQISPPPSGPPSGPPPAGPSQPPAAPCPPTVPSCLNTWLFTTSCKDNTDSECFCTKPDFTSKVMDCVNSYGASADEIAKAMAYIQGICAKHIPQNPGLVTAVPATIPAAAITSQPMTTVSVSAVIPVPAGSTTLAAGVAPPPDTTTTVSTVITVPQVGFTTNEALPTPSAGLCAGTPPNVPANATSVAPAGSQPPAGTQVAAAPAGSPSSGIQYGAATRSSVSSASWLVSAVLAIAALL